MIDLVFTICLAVAPEQCAEQVITLEVEGPARSACAIAAPVVFEEFGALHPEMTITRWRCDDQLRTAEAE